MKDNDDEKYRFAQMEEQREDIEHRKPKPTTEIRIPFWEAVSHYINELRLIWRWRTSHTKDGFGIGVEEEEWNEKFGKKK